jgi:hypothetical protein
VTGEILVETSDATRAMVRAEEWLAVILAALGAAAAVNLFIKEKGEHFHDFDVPGDAEELFGSLVDSS